MVFGTCPGVKIGRARILLYIGALGLTRLSDVFFFFVFADANH